MSDSREQSTENKISMSRSIILMIYNDYKANTSGCSQLDQLNQVQLLE